MTDLRPTRALLFDIGDTLVRAAEPGTPVTDLQAQPIGDVVRDLTALARHFRLGAVTDTSVMTESDVRSALTGTGLSELLEVIVTSADLGVAKPDPAGLRRAIELLDVQPSDALFVGDAEVDRGAAEAAGVAYVTVDPVGGPGRAVRTWLTGRRGAFDAATAFVGPVDQEAAALADEHQARLTKPPGALGRLEALGAQLAAISGSVPPPGPHPAAVAVFAGDHGVLAEGVSPWPQEVTAQMVSNLVAGGAAVNVLARQAGATVTVVDVGVATDLGDLGPNDGTTLRRANVRRGTANLAVEPAMTRAEALAALDVGAALASELVEAGARSLVTGDMGIANTTPSAALIAAFTGRPSAEVTGRGTGIDDQTLAAKVAAIERGLARLDPSQRADPGSDPVAILAEVGGLEIAALAGFIVGGASYRVPVVVDGVIAGAALLVAAARCPAVVPSVVAGHRSNEPGASAVLHHLGLEPLLDLGLRLGEGSGAVLALPLIEAAARILGEMATFDGAGVSQKG